MKKIQSIEEVAFGNEIHYVVKYIGGSSKIVSYLTKEMKDVLNKNNH